MKLTTLQIVNYSAVVGEFALERLPLPGKVLWAVYRNKAKLQANMSAYDAARLALLKRHGQLSADGTHYELARVSEKRSTTHLGTSLPPRSKPT